MTGGDLKTLPMLAQAWGASLDALRAIVRKNPDLRKLGRLFGPVRVFDPAEAELIATALERKAATAAK